MLSPEQNYTLLATDLNSAGLEIFLRDVDTSTNATTVNADLDVPAGRILILTTFSIRAEFTAGAGNGLQIVQFSVSGPTPRDFILLQGTGSINVAVNTQKEIHGEPQVWVPAGGLLRAEAIFAVADPSNRVRLEVSGVLIPRGNVLMAGA